MPPFPWDPLKAETLRAVCRDLQANKLGRRKCDMVDFLKDVETRGLSAALQDGESIEGAKGKAVSAAPRSPPPASDDDIDMAPEPVTKAPDQRKDVDPQAGERSDSEPESVGAAEPECPCADGWLSPRMKFILSTVAAVASDLVLDTGDMAIELGSIGAVYMAQYIPTEELPRGRKSIALWLEGYSTIFREIHKSFEAGRIPSTDTLSEILAKLPKSDLKAVNAYTKGTEVEHALYGLVRQAKEEWKDDFQHAHCHGSKEWKGLPVCKKHDLDWTLAEDMLTE